MALFFEAQSERIWRIPTAKSVDRPAPGEELVVGPPYQVQPEGWTVTPEEIVYIDRARSNRPAAIRAYRIATKQTRLIWHCQRSSRTETISEFLCHPTRDGFCILSSTGPGAM
jgi:hypothetical protein